MLQNACVLFFTAQRDLQLIEHTSCMPPFLANRLTNWLPARPNDKQAQNLPLLPADTMNPTALHSPTCYLRGETGQITRQSGLHRWLTVPEAVALTERDRYSAMIELDAAYRPSGSRFTKEPGQCAAFCRASAAESCERRRSWRMGGSWAEASIKHVQPKTELQHIQWQRCRLWAWLTLTSNASFNSLFLSSFLSVHVTATSD